MSNGKEPFIQAWEIDPSLIPSTANNTLFVGTVSAANVVSNAQLTANIASVTALIPPAMPFIDLATQFNIKHDGTDQTSKFNAAFAAYPGRVLKLSRVGTGVCYIHSALTIPNGTVLQMDDDVVLNCLQFKVTGSVGSQVNFTVSAAKGANSFTLANTTGIVADTWLLLQGCVSLSNTDGGSDQLLWDASTTIFGGEFVRVQSVAGNVVTIWGSLRWNYTLSPGATTTIKSCSTAQIINFAKATIRGGTIIPIVGVANSVIQGVYVRGLIVDGVTIDHRSGTNADTQQIQTLALYTSLESGGKKCTIFRDIHGNNSGSPSLRDTFVYYDSTECFVENCYIDGGAQGLNVDYTNGIGTTNTGGSIAGWGHVFSQNVVRNSGDGATSHGGGKMHRFLGNTFDSCKIGVRVRSPETLVASNMVTGQPSAGQGAGIYLQDGFLDGCIVSNNIIDRNNFGIYIEWDNINSGNPTISGRIMITGNSLISCTTSIVIKNSIQYDALLRSVIIRELQSINPTSAHFSIDPYSNGLEIVDSNFVGTGGIAAITLPVNTSRIHLGVNTFDDIGSSSYAIAGPGTTVITDTTTWPSGDSAAFWIIEPQIVRGTNAGVLTNFPATNAFLGTQTGFINIASGRVALSAGASQTTNPLAIVSGGSDVFGVDGAGKINGALASALVAMYLAGAWSDAGQIALNAALSTPYSVPLGLRGINGVNFITGPIYRSPGGGTVTSLSSVSGWTLTRTGTTNNISARAYDMAANEYAFSGNAPRVVSGRGLGIFETATNMIGVGDGALSGATPYLWTPTSAAGVTVAYYGRGIDTNGRAYVDIEVSGTASAPATKTATYTGIEIDNGGDMTVAGTGVSVTFTVGVKIQSGSLPSGTTLYPRIIERIAASAKQNDNGSSITPSSTLTDIVYTDVTSYPSVDTMSAHLGIAFPTGAAFGSSGSDLILRIYEPMVRTSALSVPYVQTNGVAGYHINTVGGDVASLGSISLTTTGGILFFAEAEMNASNAAIQILAQLDDGTTNNSIKLYRDASGVATITVTAGGSSVYSATLSGQTGAINLKLAVLISGTSISTSINGGTISSGTLSSTLSATLTALHVGSDLSGSNQLNGYIRAILFGTALSSGTTLNGLSA